MELTVSLKIKIDDDKVFNALPQVMQEAVVYHVEQHQKRFNKSMIRHLGVDHPDNIKYLNQQRSSYISDYARLHFGDFFTVSNAVVHKELGVDVNDAEVTSQKFRGDDGR